MLGMATNTVVTVTDDLDGSSGAVPFEFEYGGVRYAIDLSKKNVTAFDKAVKPYIEAARKVTSASSSRAARRRSVSSGKKDLGAIRSWAAENGFEVSTRGRIAADVVEAYDAAH